LPCRARAPLFLSRRFGLPFVADFLDRSRLLRPPGPFSIIPSRTSDAYPRFDDFDISRSPSPRPVPVFGALGSPRRRDANWRAVFWASPIRLRSAWFPWPSLAFAIGTGTRLTGRITDPLRFAGGFPPVSATLVKYGSARILRVGIVSSACPPGSRRVSVATIAVTPPPSHRAPGWSLGFFERPRIALTANVRVCLRIELRRF